MRLYSVHNGSFRRHFHPCQCNPTCKAFFGTTSVHEGRTKVSSQTIVNSATDIMLALLYAPGATGAAGEPIRGFTRLEKLMFLIDKETGLGQIVDKEYAFEAKDFGGGAMVIGTIVIITMLLLQLTVLADLQSTWLQVCFLFPWVAFFLWFVFVSYLFRDEWL
jgi:hypothetical protein